MTVRLSILLAATPLFAGCASIVENTPGAPEWFTAKAQEIRGQGYPDLREVPTERPAAPENATAEDRANTLRIQTRTIEEAASTDPIPTPDEIRARAAQLRARADETRRPDTGPPPGTASGSP